MTWPSIKPLDKQPLISGPATTKYKSVSWEGKTDEEPEVYDETPHGSNWGAYFNLVCIMAGSGVLQLPFCLRQGGWIGLGSIALCSYIAYYSGVLLIKCLYVDGKRLNNLAEVGQITYGNVGRALVNFFTGTMLFGSSALFFILASSNFRQLFHETLPSITGTHWIILCTMLIWPPFVFMKTLKEVAILSFFGAFSTLIMVFIVLVTGMMDLPHYSDANHEYVNWMAFPSVLASIGFSFGGNSVFPHVEHGMGKRKDWPKVLRNALLTVFAMYFVTAFVGYYVYGDTVESPILKTLPSGLCLNFAIVVITAHVLLTNPILLASLSLEAEHAMKIDRIHMSCGRELLSRVAFRSLMLGSSAFVAINLPYFAEVVTLLGAVSNSMLIFVSIIGCACSVVACTNWHLPLPTKVIPIVFNNHLFGGPTALSRKAWETVVVLIGFMSCGFGTYTACLSLYEKINEGR
ncbi:hypothetical protein K493DRAFT_393001 [Basidiobolus meristosporus CBS 931.73]|uniref:Amino acid transporter transmembrane domain-containing protein n=1 Tax=Basidiobolus meristosporus CBS 931.73 TaxID=1314790 RepID=A0A1Y1YPG2_9FUNG|nr:hypothetical protein K493DRAFT_393001 [Basidiobolus meristosporus CBS 931.73]|eukprot:ORX99865.1 hypothetical protein K493DRAFT_393001 [Basidiobolus meristosporus CBS 931.73]